MLALAGISFLGALMVTRYVMSFARKNALLLDVPNERSSHSVPTVRGGGFSIVILTVAAGIFVYQAGWIDTRFFMAILAGGLIVAVAGGIDDHFGIGSGKKAILHILAAVWALVCLGGVTSFDLFVFKLQWPVVTNFLAILVIVWLTNLYNFMDGTDGLAAVQCICSGMLGAILFMLAGQQGLGALCLALSAASAGFLVWNWAPAQIFMGDVGSCFIGFMFGVMAVSGEQAGAMPAYLWAAIIGLFFWDSTLTLARRLLAGEPWYLAHKSHAYQRLVQYGFGHATVAAGAFAANALFVWPVIYVFAVLYDMPAFSTLIVSVCCASVWGYIQYKFSGAIGAK